MDLHAIHPCLLSNDRSGDEFLDHCFDFFGLKRSRLFSDDLAGHVGSRDGLFTADQSARSLVAGMVELNEQFRVIGMHRLHQSVELRYHMCVRDAQLIWCSYAGLVVHAGDLGDDQTCAASCAV